MTLASVDWSTIFQNISANLAIALAVGGAAAGISQWLRWQRALHRRESRRYHLDTGPLSDDVRRAIRTIASSALQSELNISFSRATKSRQLRADEQPASGRVPVEAEAPAGSPADPMYAAAVREVEEQAVRSLQSAVDAVSASAAEQVLTIVQDLQAEHREYRAESQRSWRQNLMWFMLGTFVSLFTTELRAALGLG